MKSNLVVFVFPRVKMEVWCLATWTVLNLPCVFAYGELATRPLL